MSRYLITWGPAASWAAVLFFLSSLPDLDRLPLLVPAQDKLAHLVLYAVLGGALLWARRRTGRIPPWAFLAAGIVYGLTDEWHQSWVPGRDPSLADWVADTLGVFLGYGCAAALFPAQRAGPLRLPQHHP